MLCSQHIVLVIQMEFSSKHYQVGLLLTRKEKLPKYQEIPIISAGSKKHFPSCPLSLFLKKNSQTRLAAIDYLDRRELLWKLFQHQKSRFCFTDNSQVSHLFRLAIPISHGLRFLVCDSRNQNQQTEMLKKGVNSITETGYWASATLV